MILVAVFHRKTFRKAKIKHKPILPLPNTDAASLTS